MTQLKRFGIYALVPMFFLWLMIVTQLRISDSFKLDSTTKKALDAHELRWVTVWLCSTGLNSIFLVWYQRK
jgi:hypothetical protein